MDRDKQEPVAHVYRIESNGRPCVAWDNTSEIKVGAKLYAAPREWVGLTEEEIWKCNKASGNAVEFHICYEHQNVLDFAEAIEAKLKEKNT
jgi:hypothetical protein